MDLVDCINWEVFVAGVRNGVYAKVIVRVVTTIPTVKVDCKEDKLSLSYNDDLT